MAIDSGAVRRIALLVTLFLPALFSSPALYAQTAGSSRIDGRFVQRFAWSEDENTMHYEVIIEREENGEYRGLIHEFTAMSLIEVSLPSGNYRYRIIPYNYLNRPGPETQWIYIEVLHALRPEVTAVSHDAVRLDEGEDYILVIQGHNIEPDADIELRSPDGASVIPYTKEVTDDGAYVSLFFAGDQLSPGDYELFIRNPGGHETSGGTLTIVRPEASSAGTAVAGTAVDGTAVDEAAVDGTSVAEAAVAQAGVAETASAEAAPASVRSYTLSASIGTTFAAPLFIATIHGTYSLRQDLFLEAGLDLGVGSVFPDVDYVSVYPYVRIGLLRPLPWPAGRQAEINWYAGAGVGFMLASYTFPEDNVSHNTFTVDLTAGISLFNFIDISYTLRTGFKGVNHKISAGYVYRFK